MHWNCIYRYHSAICVIKFVARPQPLHKTTQGRLDPEVHCGQNAPCAIGMRMACADRGRNFHLRRGPLHVSTSRHPARPRAPDRDRPHTHPAACHGNWHIHSPSTALCTSATSAGGARGPARARNSHTAAGRASAQYQPAYCAVYSQICTLMAHATCEYLP